MKKEIFYIILAFYNLISYSQNSKISSDSIYLNVDETNIENFKDVYIENFTFPNPTLDMELSNKFQPTSDKLFYDKYKINGKVKKITTYTKFYEKGDKQFYSYSLYDENGLKTMTNEQGHINVYFFYDSKNRLSKKIRVVNNDTLFNYDYEYNDRNQLIKYDNSVIEYDKQHRPVFIEYNPKYRNSIIYDNNIVKVNTNEYVYSENYNRIKEIFGKHIVFNSYNNNNELIKKVTFINKKLNSIQYFEYNQKGDIIRHTFQFAIDKVNGTKSEQIYKYEYDDLGNKIYENSSGSITNSTTEYFYEIEYY